MCNFLSLSLCLFLITNVLVYGSQTFGRGLYADMSANDSLTTTVLRYYNTQNGNISTVQSRPTPPSEASLSEYGFYATIDQVNNLYFVYNSIVRDDQRYGALLPFNLSNPSQKMENQVIYDCYAEVLVGVGIAFGSNVFTGDIYMWCRNNTNWLGNAILLKLKWNNITSKLDSTVIKTYTTNLTDTLTESLCTIVDSKRNLMWFTRTHNDTTNNPTGIWFPVVDLNNGTIYKELTFLQWYSTIAYGIYSVKLDVIVSVRILYYYKDNIQYIGLNISHFDSTNGNMIESIAQLDGHSSNDFGNYTDYYCDSYDYIYSFDDDNGIWYQLLFRKSNNKKCDTNYGNGNDWTGDLAKIDVNTGKFLGIAVPKFCRSYLNEGLNTCPESCSFLN